MATLRLTAKHTAVLVVDPQEKLLPRMHNAEALEMQIRRLIDGAHALGLPVLATEQYPKGLGPIVRTIRDKLGPETTAHDKLKFSALIEPIRAELAQHGARSVLVCGNEAHVCVLQTCLDLADAGLIAAVVVDAIGSRRETDQQAAVSRMIQAGVIPTTVESALFEIAYEAAGEGFKSLLPIVK